MAQHLNSEQSTADRANHGMHRVPDRIYPRNFIGKKFEEIENTCNAYDPRVREDFERLILRRESDPVEMNCKPSGKDGEVEINPGKRSETERDAEEVQSFHGGNLRPS